jgi:hypothetical protein
MPSSADLGEEIGKAVEDSRYLIVLCSPHSAKSHWVNKEITEFQTRGRSKRILALLALESLHLLPTVQGDLALRNAIARLPGCPNRFKIGDVWIAGISFDGSRFFFL